MAKTSTRRKQRKTDAATPEPPKYDYSKPSSVEDVLWAFPANVIGPFLPPMDQLPAVVDQAWLNLAHDWFYKGLCGSFVEKDGIDLTAAKRHLSACLRSYEPKQEHKMKGVAYLMSLWFERFEPHEGTLET